MKNLIEHLFMQHMNDHHIVFARMYANGSWHQFSGKDVCSHIFLATQYWNDIFRKNSVDTIKNDFTLIFIATNSYHTFIASIAAILNGFHIVWMPIHTSQESIQEIKSVFPCTAIVTNMEDTNFDWSQFNLPVIGIDRIAWMAQESSILKNKKYFKQLFKQTLGKFHFVMNESCQDQFNQINNLDKKNKKSFQHTNKKYVSLNINSIITTARNFIEQSNIPDHILWHSTELMSLDHPFAHISKFCALLKNGIIGFPSDDIETSLSILKPTYLFVSSHELEQISAIEKFYHDQPSSMLQLKIKKALSKAHRFLGTSKAMKIPENLFAMLKRGMRTTSRILASDAFMPNGFDNLRFIVHGLSPANKKSVQIFESYGIPVIETYGSTLSAGMLSSNTFHLPHLNMIGTPLAHVYFRLGAQSKLEYKLSSDFSDSSEHHTWYKTNDTVQMTPFGFILANHAQNKNQLQSTSS